MLYLRKEAQITGESFQGSAGTSLPTQIQFAAVSRTVAKVQPDQALIGKCSDFNKCQNDLQRHFFTE